MSLTAHAVTVVNVSGLCFKVLILAVASFLTVIGYRFVVFLITLYTTGIH